MAIFTDVQLMRAAREGEVGAAKALSVLSKRKVSVATRKARMVPYEQTMEIFDKVKEHSIVAYTQAISGIGGMSILSMERAEALRLVDLFNGRPENTTKVMQELDRSTVRETLNILANSYATQLGNDSKVRILLGVPGMVTRSHLVGMMEKLKTNSGKGELAFLFETDLSVDDTEFKVSLYFFFLARMNDAENN
ncbi:MAG: hypothetical protein WC823_01285 [Parcubacteria group bacterium]|jgi:chemotaxis protein CheY-P-specific phosphatase CheC